MPITEEQLKEWEEIEKQATEGPWDTVKAYDCALGIKTIVDGVVYNSATDFATEDDLKFISVARTAFPFLIQTCYDLMKKVEDLEALLDDYKNERPHDCIE